MSSSLTNVFGNLPLNSGTEYPPNNGRNMQINEYTLNLNQITRDISNTSSLIEKAMILNLVQGKSATEVSFHGIESGKHNEGIYTELTSSTNPTTYQTHMLINNSIIDTPNLGLISHMIDLSYGPHSLDISLCKNTYDTFHAHIFDTSDNIVVLNDTLKMYFIDSREWTNGDHVNTDSDGRYYVGFDTGLAGYTTVHIDNTQLNKEYHNPNSENYWASKAFNSRLNARDEDGNPYNPIKVDEPSFNFEYAMGGYGSSLSSLGSDVPFTRYYTTDNNSESDGDKIPPSDNEFNGNNYDPISEETMYKVQTLKSNPEPYYSHQQWGTWKFEQMGAVGGINASVRSVYNDDPNNLPFRAGMNNDNGEGISLQNGIISELDFQRLFPDVPSDVSFSYSITSTNNQGGYYFEYSNNNIEKVTNTADHQYSTITDNYYDNKNGGYNDIVQLDFSNLSNSNVYMRNNYQNQTHKLHIKNGTLDVFGMSNYAAENLAILQNNSYTDRNGDMSYALPYSENSKTFGIEAEYLDSEFVSTSGTITLKIPAPYDRATMQDYNPEIDPHPLIIYNTMSDDISNNDYYSDNDHGFMNDDWRRISDISISYTCLLDGVHIIDGNEGYYYTNKDKNEDDKSSIYNTESKSILYAGQRINNLSYTNQSNFSNDYDYIYIEITATQDLVDPSNNRLYDLSLNPSGSETPSHFGHLSSGDNANFIPSIHIKNFDASKFPDYVNYRAIFKTKTLSDFKNSVSLGNSEWSFITGTTFTVNDDGLTYGDISFNMDDTESDQYSGQYLYTKFNNLNVPGTNANMLNKGRACGINIKDLNEPTDDERPYIFSITYESAQDIGGTDLVRFTADDPTTRNYITNDCFEFTLQPIIVEGDNETGFKAVVQVPLGEYYNLYLKTPLLHATMNGEEEEISGIKTTTMTFTRSALFSLLASIQGSDSQSSDYTNVSENENHWVDISQRSTTPGDPEAVSVSAYYKHTSNAYIIPTSGSDNAQVEISIELKPEHYKYNNYHLIWPAYAVKLHTDTSANIKVVGRKYSIDSDAQKINSSFNPSDFVHDSASNFYKLGGVEGGMPLNLGHNVEKFDNSTANTLHITGDITADIIFPYQMTSNLSIWYCPQDIYKTENRLRYSSVDDEYNTYYTRSHNSNNSNAYLQNGVFLTDTTFMRAGYYGIFKINGDHMKVQMVNEQDFNQSHYTYDLDNNSSEISYENGGLDLFWPGKTRSFHIPWYRGYFDLDFNPETGSTQTYEINRSPTTAWVDIIGDSGLNQIANIDSVYYNSESALDFYSDADDVNDDIRDSMNLRIKFVESMLPYDDIPYGDTLDISINVVGDDVKVDQKQNGISQSFPNNNLYDLPTNYPYTINMKTATKGILSRFGEDTPNDNDIIYTGRVKANSSSRTTNATDEVSYRIDKDSQSINIFYSKTWLQDPSNVSRTWGDPIATVKNSTFNSGIQLNPNLKIWSPSGSRISSMNEDGTNTPITYLVIPPPYLGFTALAADAVSKSYGDGLPFSTNPSLDKPGHYNDNSYNITWYLPAASYMNPNSNNDKETWNPFHNKQLIESRYNCDSGHLDSLNDMTFTRTKDRGLIDYVKQNQVDTKELDVKGNVLVIFEYVKGKFSPQNNNTNVAQHKSLYFGFIQDLNYGTFYSSNMNTQNITIDVERQLYTMNFAQNLNEIGVENGNGSNIFLTFTNAFIKGEYDFVMYSNSQVDSKLYGVSPIINESGEYCIQPYKYTSYYNTINYDIAAQVGADIKKIQFIADNRYKLLPIPLPAANFNDSPYNLQTQQRAITTTDISNASAWQWILDTSFNSEGGQVPLNFEFVALSNTGKENIKRLVSIVDPSFILRAEYITLPDILNIESAEGSSVFRILYNGSIVSPMLSTSQVIINPIANYETEAETPNQEFVSYNIGNNAGTIADASGIYYV
jgi:hypothetical protein